MLWIEFSKVTPVKMNTANVLGHERLQTVQVTPTRFSPVILINEPKPGRELQPHLIPTGLRVTSRGQTDTQEAADHSQNHGPLIPGLEGPCARWHC